VFLTGDHVRSLKADLGKQVWQHPFVDALLESSTTPVKAGDLFVVGSVKSGSVGVRVKGTEVEEVWKNDKLTCYFSTPVVAGDYLYMVNGEAKFPGGTLVMRCVEAKSGDIKWEKKDVGTYHAAFVKTGDGKLLLHDDKGNLKLLEPSEKEYKEVASSKVCGTTWAHPAVSDGRIYIRDEKTLYCLEVGAAK
jgi:outer membrane protein assembly factor BamB